MSLAGATQVLIPLPLALLCSAGLRQGKQLLGAAPAADGSPPEREPRQQLRDEQQPRACGVPDANIVRRRTRAMVSLAGMPAGITFLSPPTPSTGCYYYSQH